MVLMAFMSVILLCAFRFNWYHSAFIGRFYIFTLGILVYFYITKRVLPRMGVYIISILCFIGVVSLLVSPRFQYWGTALACPLLIVVLSVVPNRFANMRFIQLCGIYSLEIFIANCWTMLIMQYVAFHNIYTKLITYFISQLLFTIVLVLLNKKLFKKLSNNKAFT